MTLITDDMRGIVESSRLCFVATVNADGSPNLSPKGSLRVRDDRHLAFMDIASPGSMANLARDPRIAINAIDFLRRRGYRFSGTTTFHEPGDPVYDWLHDWLLELNGPGYPAHRAVLVEVEHAAPILSPAYTWGHAEEAALAAGWARNYGLVP